MRPQAGLITIQFPGQVPVDLANYPDLFLTLSTTALAQKMLALFPTSGVATAALVDATDQQSNGVLTFFPGAVAMGIRNWDIEGNDPNGIAFDCSVGEMAFWLQHPLVPFGDSYGIPVKPRDIGTPAGVGLSVAFYENPVIGYAEPIWKYTAPAPGPLTLADLQAEIAQLSKVKTGGPLG